MKEQEKEDWETFKAANQNAAPVTGGPLGALAKLGAAGGGGLAQI